MHFYSPLMSYHRPHTAKIYAVATRPEGDTRVDRDEYVTVSCYAHQLDNAKINAMMGAAMKDRFKIFLPLKTNAGDTLAVKFGYHIDLTLESGTVRHLGVEGVREFPASHIEVDGVDIDV